MISDSNDRKSVDYPHLPSDDLVIRLDFSVLIIEEYRIRDSLNLIPLSVSSFLTVNVKLVP